MTFSSVTRTSRNCFAPPAGSLSLLPATKISNVITSAMRLSNAAIKPWRCLRIMSVHRNLTEGLSFSL